MLVVRPKKREDQNLSLHAYPEKRYIGSMVYVGVRKGGALLWHLAVCWM